MQFRTIPAGAIRIALPNIAQQDGHTCGPAAIAAIRAYYDVGGCEAEAQLVGDMGLVDDAGSDPSHLVRAVEASKGLEWTEWREMTDAQLIACLDRAHPVVMMLQAWAEPKPVTYDGWSDGHWVVAIGYDSDGVYFEDPSLYCRRGYLGWAELQTRWHDIEGPDHRETVRYGLEVWRPGVEASQFDNRAAVIE